jgi:hypothetical protein
MAFIHDDPSSTTSSASSQSGAESRSAAWRRTTGSRQTLWAIQHQGFEVWFKGGTSLSKGFGLIPSTGCRRLAACCEKAYPYFTSKEQVSS